MRPCHDQLQRWCEGHLGNDLLADLVEYGRLLDFPLYCRLVRFQTPCHVVEGLGQDAYLIVGIMLHRDRTLASRMRFAASASRRIGLVRRTHVDDGKHQRNPRQGEVRIQTTA